MGGRVKKSRVWVVTHIILPKELRSLPCQGIFFFGFKKSCVWVFGYIVTHRIIQSIEKLQPSSKEPTVRFTAASGAPLKAMSGGAGSGCVAPASPSRRFERYACYERYDALHAEL